MEREFRISAGAIVFDEDRLLLVRYASPSGTSYLVAPGGGVLIDEGTRHAAAREVLEETGLEILPGKILFVEDLLSQNHRITKIWFLGSVSGGQLTTDTQEALEEGITGVGWYLRGQLRNEVVFPRPLLSHDWSDFLCDDWQTQYLDLSVTDF